MTSLTHAAFFDRTFQPVTGVVHQHIDLSMVSKHGGEHTVDRGFVRYVEQHAVGESGMDRFKLGNLLRVSKRADYAFACSNDLQIFRFGSAKAWPCTLKHRI